MGKVFLEGVSYFSSGSVHRIYSLNRNQGGRNVAFPMSAWLKLTMAPINTQKQGPQSPFWTSKGGSFIELQHLVAAF